MATLTQLERSAETVNRRYAAGLNDDDQVSKMFSIAKGVDGYRPFPCWDTYEIVTDEEYDKRMDLRKNQMEIF